MFQNPVDLFRPRSWSNTGKPSYPPVRATNNTNKAKLLDVPCRPPLVPSLLFALIYCAWPLPKGECLGISFMFLCFSRYEQHTQTTAFIPCCTHSPHTQPAAHDKHKRDITSPKEFGGNSINSNLINWIS